MMNVTLIPALQDNYIYLLTWDEFAAVIDPAEADPVKEALKNHSLQLKYILNTHHHGDHTAGNRELHTIDGVSLMAPEDSRIPHADVRLKEGDVISIGNDEVHILSVPGHTLPHIAYYFPQREWLFCGDALFAGGCGRVFEGTMEQMLASLQKLKALPPTTKVYCGHEYTVKNLNFALSICPEDQQVQERLQRVKMMREKGSPSLPSTLEEEWKTNLFLRVDEKGVQKSLGMEGESSVAVFAELRGRRDCF